MTDANKAALAEIQSVRSHLNSLQNKEGFAIDYKSHITDHLDRVENHLRALTTPAANTGDRFNEGRTEMCQHCQGSGENRNPLNDPGPCQECDGHGYFKPALQRPEPSEGETLDEGLRTLNVENDIRIIHAVAGGSQDYDNTISLRLMRLEALAKYAQRAALAPRQVDVEGLIPEDFNKFFGAVRNALDGRAEQIDGINALEEIAVVFNRVRLAQRGLIGNAPDNKKLIEALQSAKACFEIILDSANANADLTDEGIANLFNTTIQTIDTALGDKND